MSFMTSAELVSKAVGTVSSALLEATVLVIILLGLFLGDVRAAVTVALVLPLAAADLYFDALFNMSANR